MNNDLLRDATLLVFANKQDLPHAASASALSDKLGLHGLNRNRKWYVQPCSATSGAGLFEGLDWLTKCVTVPNGAELTWYWAFPTPLSSL